MECSDCDGTGESALPNQSCFVCNGTGELCDKCGEAVDVCDGMCDLEDEDD